MSLNVQSERDGRRKLSLFDVLCIGVNSIVGSGVFALPDNMQRAMGGWSPLAYVLCSVALMPVALCFAELSGRFADTGGAYVYARAAFGQRAGFLIGWFCWVNTFIAWAANTTLFLDLVGVHSPAANKSISIAFIVALGAINYFGVKPGAWLVNLVVIGKVAAILFFLGVAAGHVHTGPLGGALPAGLRGVGAGVYLALFPLQGFEVTPVTAGETDQPKRNVPLATIGSLLFSALLFIAVQAALVGSYPHLANDSEQPLVDAALYLGPRVGLIVLVGSMISIGGFNAGSALGSPRYAQAIAAHGLLPKGLAKVHPRWATPHVSIIWTTGLTAVLALFFDYRTLIGMSNVAVVIQYVSSCIAVPIVRKRATEPSHGWVMPGGPILPALGAIGSIALLVGADPIEIAFSAGALVVGVATMFWMESESARSFRAPADG